MGDSDRTRAPSATELGDLEFSFQIPEVEEIDVFVVDDDKTSLRFIAGLIERIGHPVQAFSNPKDALEAIQAYPPKILVADIIMPEMNGLELAERARARDPNLGIILVTSHGNERTAEATLRLGMSHFLLKPVELPSLSKALQRAFLRRAADDHHRAMVNWMYAELDRNATAIREVTVGTLTSLINAVDARSPHFRGHSQAVAMQAAAVAQALGLSEDEVEAIRTAGLLHDVGMIAVPDAVIGKLDALTPEELALIRAHSAAGASIIQPMKHLGPIIQFVLEHHERWDGSGYPAGAAGDEISLGGQIVGIAEAWTGIVESRAYREGRSREEGLEILLSHKGQWFTDEVTAALVDSDVGVM